MPIPMSIMDRDFTPYGEIPYHNLYPYYAQMAPQPQMVQAPKPDARSELGEQMHMPLSIPQAHDTYPDTAYPAQNTALMYPVFGQKIQARPPPVPQPASHQHVPPATAPSLQVPRTQHNSYEWCPQSQPVPQVQAEYSFQVTHDNADSSPSSTRRRSSASIEGDGSHNCVVCGKQFHRAYNLKSHMRTHSTERPYKCRLCPKTFARSHDRKRHEALHGGEKNFICEGYLSDGVTKTGCGKRFARADALTRHYRTEAGYFCLRQKTEDKGYES